MKARKKAKKRSPRLKMTSVQINLGAEHRAYIAELAEYACCDIPTVCAVMMACGIFKAKRFELPDKNQEMLTQQAAKIMDLEATLCRCRQVMEANDPGNALDIFGPPQAPPAEPAASV